MEQGLDELAEDEHLFIDSGGDIDEVDQEVSFDSGFGVGFE